MLVKLGHLRLKELQKKSKINPLELTLDKFDKVVDRFSEVIMSLDLSGGQLPDKSDLDAALEQYGPEKVIAVLQAQQAAAERDRKLKEQQQAEARVREGFMGDALADVMFPKEEQDATSKVLESIGVPESMQPATAMVVESMVEAALMSRGRGVKRPVITRPLTKPYSLQGPELPPVQGPTQRIPSPAEIRARVVRSADTLQRPEVRPTEPIVQTPNPLEPRKRPVKRFGPRKEVTPRQLRLKGADNRAAAETFAQRGKLEDDMSGRTGAFEKRANQDRQNLDFAKSLDPDNVPADARPMGKTVVKYDDGPVEFNMPEGAIPRITPEEYIFRRLQREYPGQDINKLLEGKGVDPSGLQSNASGINYYTSYNAPNNTTIIMQNGGQMPPQSPPPQMVASAPPPKMPPGPSTYDLASTLGTAILINRLQEC
jgi:hypothetical protein